jgi:hypothetical protein
LESWRMRCLHCYSGSGGSHRNASIHFMSRLGAPPAEGTCSCSTAYARRASALPKLGRPLLPRTLLPAHVPSESAPGACGVEVELGSRAHNTSDRRRDGVATKPQPILSLPLLPDAGVPSREMLLRTAPLVSNSAARIAVVTTVPASDPASATMANSGREPDDTQVDEEHAGASRGSWNRRRKRARKKIPH